VGAGIGRRARDFARYLRSKGVSKAFVDKVVSVPRDGIWYVGGSAVRGQRDHRNFTQVMQLCW
jgi:hypothetical protein